MNKNQFISSLIYATIAGILVGIGTDSVCIGVGLFLAICSINNEQERHHK